MPSLDSGNVLFILNALVQSFLPFQLCDEVLCHSLPFIIRAFLPLCICLYCSIHVDYFFILVHLHSKS